MGRSPRSTFQDYTRISQPTCVEGWAEVDGVRHRLPAGSLGVRHRWWGIRSMGIPDPQPYASAVPPQFFWAWAPLLRPGARWARRARLTATYPAEELTLDFERTAAVVPRFGGYHGRLSAAAERAASGEGPTWPTPR